MARYAKGNPYRGERLPRRNRKDNPDVWRFVLRITEQPREQVALSFGDAIHNLRTCLDHIAVAIVPSDRKSHAKFPCLNTDIWRLDAAGDFVCGDEDRMSFEQRVRGMPPEAVAFILEMQPYQAPQPQELALSVLNRLDVADKHRRLIALVSVVAFPKVTLTVRGESVGYTTMHGGLVEDGAEIFTLDTSPWPGLADEEVQVHVTGAPVVAIEVSEESGHVEAERALKTISGFTKETLRLFEHFVRR
jgi:hypothetical protein